MCLYPPFDLSTVKRGGVLPQQTTACHLRITINNDNVTSLKKHNVTSLNTARMTSLVHSAADRLGASAIVLTQSVSPSCDYILTAVMGEWTSGRVGGVLLILIHTPNWKSRVCAE